MTQVARDDVPRVRPGRVRVRIVVRPHAVVDTPPIETVASYGVVEERAVDLAVEVEAWRLRDRRRVRLAEAAVVVVPLLEEEGNPADLVLNVHDLELRETLEDAVENHVEEGVHRVDG